ncbi:DUF6018 family natural product bioysynthesis protein [Piscibacillus sp. B03]|uniref:DUF6018 family natural product bioysynthesis protein n=1 Tax=Piscibacillus sp. B03 TaxID=3457430 RepID=UPI003FCE2591
MMLAAVNPMERKTQKRIYHLDGAELHFESAKRTDCMYKAEIRLEDGKKRYYHCRALTKKNAMKEVSVFVKSIEDQTGQKVAWRFSNESAYRLGHQIEDRTIKSRLKRLANEFFELD